MANRSKPKSEAGPIDVEHALVRATLDDSPAQAEKRLYERVVSIVEGARSAVDRTVDTAALHANWRVGREIVLVEQAGQERASYGEQLMARLSERLTVRLGRGFGIATLRRMRQLYLTYPHGSSLASDAARPPIRSALLIESSPAANRSAPLIESSSSQAALFPPQLGWTHYLLLLRVSNPTARAFYEVEAAREGWGARELERQIDALLFERLATNRDPAEVLAVARSGRHEAAPGDVLKNPLVLEFLNLRERPSWHERDLEQAIIDRLEDFLLELGRGFLFAARQKRITIDGDHYYVDLVFYNRLLRAWVLFELKLGKLTPQDLGQMRLYVNYFDRYERAEHEAQTIGIVLCSSKNDAMVKIALPDCEQVMAARYQMVLPTEEELRAELARERAAAEQLLLQNQAK
jgi:predicted nuclease of restriction endonuclease-like (RecB) superfamily